MFKMYSSEYQGAIQKVLDRGAFILQEENREFDERLKSYVGARHAFGVANGTDAIIIALHAAGVGKGD